MSEPNYWREGACYWCDGTGTTGKPCKACKACDGTGRDGANTVRLHRHIEDGYRLVYTEGAGYDCPPERECWETVDARIAAVLLRSYPWWRADP